MILLLTNKAIQTRSGGFFIIWGELWKHFIGKLPQT